MFMLRMCLLGPFIGIVYYGGIDETVVGITRDYKKCVECYRVFGDVGDTRGDAVVIMAVPGEDWA
ncbi:hypothetical protein Pmar_PMAR005983 [Perkinsus marinus ATCC 50983]|uniref:Uncharacterized protein n=1 Tax=Perkinsus marinus (strain ATCC 50983 / TXsc) TaxID=423536 RepID=C5L9W5_PERM5|nr:hypothetical protein Pmar_PMAR005983 [Perkinsus marinus ATCC 50983]EER06221.1 hypothetical protein Pmar_PMAR005983 [Perkinsus marinus ATCC 50983]|eukprot:XP_002774405.1 hypothetical protein Pmar_PMAR005983 [Perkinsus marinus ATCC 50983]